MELGLGLPYTVELGPVHAVDLDLALLLHVVENDLGPPHAVELGPVHAVDLDLALPTQ